jgi:hypothetical protein
MAEATTQVKEASRMDQNTVAFSEQEAIMACGPIPVNQEHIDRDNREAWVGDNWTRLRNNTELLAVLALGPRALASLVGRMMVEIGCEPEDAMDVREIVEHSRRNETAIDAVKRRAAAAMSRGDTAQQLESLRNMMASIATDIRVLQVRLKHHDEENNHNV